MILVSPAVCLYKKIRAGCLPALIFFLKNFLFSTSSLILLMPILCSSCSVSSRRGEVIGRILEDVPFYPQEKYQCGPASLASVLNYQGINVSPEEIASAIYSKTARGTLDIDLISYVLNRGLSAEVHKGDMEEIIHSINEGYPLIVLVDYGLWVYQKNHFMVVVGYNADGVIVNSANERLKFIHSGDFLKTWGRTKFWTLSIRPKNQ